MLHIEYTFVGKMKDTNSDMMFLLIYFHPHKINFLDKKHSLKTYLFCIFFTNTNPFLQTNNLLDGSFSLPLLPTIQKLNCLSFCFFCARDIYIYIYIKIYNAEHRLEKCYIMLCNLQ